MEGLSVRGELEVAPPIELCLIGELRASHSGIDDILPPLRKARALFVVLAVADGQSVTRRWLASLLWSRTDPTQALARLRDTLSTLRQSLKLHGANADLIRIVSDRVSLQPDAVRVDLDALAASDRSLPRPDEIAVDLDGIDPALDAWLVGLRSRYRASGANPAMTGTAGGSGGVSRGLLIGIGSFHVVGSGQDSELALIIGEEIATTLSRVRGVSVVSVARAGPETGLDFTLEGSLQRAGGRLRIAVRLLETPAGVVCWSSHFDYDHDDVFHIQQDVSVRVAAGLEPELPAIAAARLRRTGSDAEGGYVLMLRAIALIHLLDRRSFNEAGELLGRVIELEPEYSPAYSWLALWHVFLVGQGWARDPRASTARAGEVAEHAVMLDPNDARGLTVAGHVRAFLHRRLDEAIPLHERALAVNPGLPLAWHLSGVAHAYKGNLDEARRRIDYSRQLAPRDPHCFFADGAAIIVELLSRDHGAAAAIGRRVTQLHPRFSAAYKPYLSALGHLNEEREAAVVRRKLMLLEPEFSLRSFRSTSPFARRDHTEHYASGLGLAGVT